MYFSSQTLKPGNGPGVVRNKECRGVVLFRQVLYYQLQQW